MVERSRDWIKQARRDLENAEYEAGGGEEADRICEENPRIL